LVLFWVAVFINPFLFDLDILLLIMPVYVVYFLLVLFGYAIFVMDVPVSVEIFPGGFRLYLGWFSLTPWEKTYYFKDVDTMQRRDTGWKADSLTLWDKRGKKVRINCLDVPIAGAIERAYEEWKQSSRP